MRLRRVPAVLAAIVVSVIGSASVAAADASGPEPWEPTHQQEWTAPAGRYCDFPLHVDVQFENMRMRVVERYDDGAVKRLEYIGTLISDLVNVDTGERLRTNSSAQAYVDMRADGSWSRLTSHGPIGAGFREGDPYPRGYYHLVGHHVIEYDTDGTRHMVVASGEQQNVCVPLS